MRLVIEVDLLDVQDASGILGPALDELRTAISAMEHPRGSGVFSLRPEKHANGVVPIRTQFTARVQQMGWHLEQPFPYQPAGVGARRFGPTDASRFVGESELCVEWETGNISSAHRSMNKLALGLIEQALMGGVLVMPSTAMYPYLTDRIGSYGELSAYLPLWASLVSAVDIGYLSVWVVEHDELSETSPLLRKGTDGRALR